MKYLAIDCSGKSLIVVAVNGDKKQVYENANCGVMHSVELMGRVEEVLTATGLTVNGLDFIACVTGAGSFTGIRIGVATVKALCFAAEKPCLTITSFDTIAYNKSEGKRLAVIDAGHGGYYVCGYDGDKVSLSPCYIDGDALKKAAAEYALMSFAPIPNVDTEVVSAAEGLIKAVDLKVDCGLTDASALTPLYVRKSQAEEGRL